MTVTWWIEDHAIVAPTSSDFAATEVSSIIDDPADTKMLGLGGSGISSSPGDGGARGVDMHGFAIGSGEGERRSSGVGEQIEKGRWSSEGASVVFEPVPIRALFGKAAHMSEGSRCQSEPKSMGLEAPIGRRLAAPAPSTSVSPSAIKASIGLRPGSSISYGQTLGSRTGPIQTEGAEALEFSSEPEIDQFVVMRAGRNAVSRPF